MVQIEVTCPHCKKTIELVGSKELDEEFGLGPNTVQHARDKGKFPDPWMSFQNRNVYLRSIIESYIEERSRAKLQSTVEELTKAFHNLSLEEQIEAREILEARLAAL